VRATLAALLAATTCACAGIEEDWRTILALDAGPKTKPASAEEARLAAANHLDKQRISLESFLQKYPTSQQAPEARLKLAAVLGTSAAMTGDVVRRKRAIGLYEQVEQSSPGSLAADAGFRKASLLMQQADLGTPQGRETAIAAARAFAARHPSDPRGPRMLVEAATVADPAAQRTLLEEARAANPPQDLIPRIEDDLRRLSHLGKPLDLQLPALNGGILDLEALRGKPVVLAFWSSESPQSLIWLRDCRAAWTPQIAANARLVAISMDPNRKAAVERARALHPEWIVGFQPGGWDAPAARSLGINALPSVWMLDSKGVVRSIQARNDWASWLSRLSPARERNRLPTTFN
jgi:hypothetical protein